MSEDNINQAKEQEDIFQKYEREFKEDTALDELNIRDRAMTTVSIKHKWVGRLMRHKREVKKLELLKKQAINKVANKLADGHVGMTTIQAKKAAETHDVVSRITSEIEQQELIIEYLEKVERILHSMTYDIKNVVDIQKLETT